MSDFGTRLKVARKNKKITQKMLARQLEVEQSTISNYENNIRFPSASALIEISKRLQVSLDYLLGRSDSKPEASNEVSGSFVPIDSSEITDEPEVGTSLGKLQKLFFEYLVNRQTVEAANLIMNFPRPDNDIMFFNKNVFEPVLRKTGRLWEAGVISVADEHLITDTISRLMTRLEQSVLQKPVDKKLLAAALMLAGPEEHELPLRMIETVFKHHGWSTYYLGRNVPISSLEDFIVKNKVHVIGLSVTLASNLNSCEVFIRAIKAIDSDIRPKIMIGGRAVANENIAINQLGADFYFESQQALDKSFADLEKSLHLEANQETNIDLNG